MLLFIGTCEKRRILRQKKLGQEIKLLLVLSITVRLFERNVAKFWIIVTSQILKKVIYSILSGFKAGDFERMRVISNDSFSAVKFSEMQVTSAQCRWVHIYVFNFYKQGFALKNFSYLGEETTNWNKTKTNCRVISKTSVAKNPSFNEWNILQLSHF